MVEKKIHIKGQNYWMDVLFPPDPDISSYEDLKGWE